MDTSESDSKTMVRLTSYDPNNTSIEKDLVIFVLILKK